MPIKFNFTLPTWLATACAVIAGAAGSMALANPLPAYQSWEIAASLFFGGLSAGTFSITQPVASKTTPPAAPKS